MITVAMKLKLITLAKKYGVEVEYFTHGYVVVRIHSWNQKKRKFTPFIEDLRDEPIIFNITANNGLVEIYYDANALENSETINRLLRILEKHIG